MRPCTCLAARGSAVLESVGQAEADEAEHDGDGRNDCHDHPQLAKNTKKVSLDIVTPLSHCN